MSTPGGARSSEGGIPYPQLGLGVLVTVIWGLNFSLIKVGEEVFDPYLLATLRFVVCAVPAIFFFKRPQVPWRYLIGYGVIFGVFQFGLLFAGIKAGLSAGLSSVVLQMQVFFTIGLGVALLRERPSSKQLAGALLALCGVGIVGAITGGDATVTGTLLVVAAAASWGLANIVVKKSGTKDMLAFMVWASLIPPIPLFLLTLWWSGWHSITYSFAHVTWAAAGAVLYLVYPTTLFGYAVWNGLLHRYKTSSVAPLTLLVPVFGMFGSWLIFDEEITAVKLFAAALMILGLLINQFGLPVPSTRRAVPQPAPQLVTHSLDAGSPSD